MFVCPGDGWYSSDGTLAMGVLLGFPICFLQLERMGWFNSFGFGLYAGLLGFPGAAGLRPGDTLRRDAPATSLWGPSGVSFRDSTSSSRSNPIGLYG